MNNQCGSFAGSWKWHYFNFLGPRIQLLWLGTYYAYATLASGSVICKFHFMECLPVSHNFLLCHWYVPAPLSTTPELPVWSPLLTDRFQMDANGSRGAWTHVRCLELEIV